MSEHTMIEERTQTADTVAAFAADLRRLRLHAESPTLARLQHDSGVSKSVISSALAGDHLPSARTVDRVTRALGADPAEWVARRDALARLAIAAEDAAPAEPSTDEPSTVEPLDDASARGRRVTLRRTVLLCAMSFALGIAIAVSGSWLVGASIVQRVRVAAGEAAVSAIDRALTPDPQIEVRTGSDPALTPCVDDAVVATSSTRAEGTLLEIIWSNKCLAGWGRVTRYDDRSAGNTVTVAIYPETAPNGPDRQEDSVPDVQGVYTNLLVRPTLNTLLCAVGSITVDGEQIDLGDPLCI